MPDGSTTQIRAIRAEELEPEHIQARSSIALRHGFFTRRGGVSSGLYNGLNVGFGSQDSTESVVENRRRAMAELGLAPENLVTLYQIHSPTVVTATHPWERDKAPQADGIVTNRPGLTLGILTADCAPVLFADREAGVIGACHAGWKGALSGVIENTVDAMEALGANRRTVTAIIGPCIAKESYEVGEEFEAQFIEQDHTTKIFFQPGVTSEKRQFDLPGFVLSRLEKAGVPQRRWVGRDTRVEEENFFSYRRSQINTEADYGRQLSAIALVDEDEVNSSPLTPSVASR